MQHFKTYQATIQIRPSEALSQQKVINRPEPARRATVSPRLTRYNPFTTLHNWLNESEI